MNPIPGTAANDIINGDTNPADLFDVLNSNWSAGNDMMVGGLSNDTYNVNSAGDVALENAGEGYDTIMSRSATFDMSTNAVQVEAITLDNTPTQLVLLPGGGFGLIPAAVSAVGNALNNYMAGNDRDNTLSGLDGSDSLYGNNGNDTLDGGNGDDYLNGGSGNDTLTGGSGNDTLFGGTGDDSMGGGLGNDTYYVDSGGDSITGELAVFGGTDKVYSSLFSYTLAAPLENLTLTGTAIYGTGNASANVIVGNASNNTLTGAAGNDTLQGGAGNDRLVGDTGRDVLTGGTNADLFVFNTSDLIGAVRVNSDTVTDFSVVDDTVGLANALDAGLAGAINPGLLGLTFNGGNFVGNTLAAGSFRENAAMTVAGIYYYDASGEVWYNPTAAAGDERILGTIGVNLSPALTSNDFVYTF